MNNLKNITPDENFDWEAFEGGSAEVGEKEQIEKAIDNYSDWKICKGENPRSDYNSMQWAFDEPKKPAGSFGRRQTAVQECGCDKVSDETLENLPF